MAASASLLLPVVSLPLSLTVAWLTLFRRGKLRATRPVPVDFLYEGEQPKVFFCAMLYATGKRGQILETLCLKVRRDDTAQTVDFWMYGETKELKIGSGLHAADPEGAPTTKNDGLPYGEFRGKVRHPRTG